MPCERGKCGDSLAAATDTRTRLLDATLREALASDAQHFAEAAE
jgi:hypothetical protein